METIYLKALLRVVVLALIAIAGTLSFAQETKPQLSISISTPDVVVKVGADIRLDIIVKNTSGREARFARSKGDAEFDYDITVHNKNGQPANKTPYGHKIHSKEPSDTPRHGGMVLIRLNPEQEYVQRITLNKLLEIQEPGTYVIQVERRDSEIKGMLKSNKLVVTVTE